MTRAQAMISACTPIALLQESCCTELSNIASAAAFTSMPISHMHILPKHIIHAAQSLSQSPPRLRAGSA